MIICGKTNSGKSHLLIELLKNEWRIRCKRIVLICPTFNNKTYKDKEFIIKHQNFVVVCCDLGDVEFWIRLSRIYSSGYRSVLTLDDIACSEYIGKRTSEVVNISFSGRHINDNIDPRLFQHTKES